MGFLDKIKKVVKDNDTSILTGIGLVDGLVLGGYLWFKAGCKATRILQNKEQEKGSKLTFKEKVKHTWKIFAIPAANTVLSASMIIVSDKISSKRFAALGIAYNITEATLQKYQNKVVEEFGEGKADKIKTAVSEDLVKEHKDAPVVDTGYGSIMIFEPTSVRNMRTNWDKVDNAVLKINEMAMLGNGKVTLSAFYRELGLKPTAISDRIGWDINRTGKIKIFHQSMLDDNETPCGCIDYYDLPYEI